MDYWHEIVKSYDDPKINGLRRKDHGTFSQKIAVILLIYLAFGTDYSAGIAKYFIDRKRLGRYSPRILLLSNKISSILKKMKDDKLVVVTKKVSVGAGIRSYYALNPQIIQSPTRESIYHRKGDSSPFNIPLDTIEDFLAWLYLENAGTIDHRQEEQLQQERHNRADEILDGLLSQWSKPDYFAFLFLIEAETALWDLQRESSNLEPILDSLIVDYIQELMDTGTKFKHFIEPKTNVRGIKEPIALGWLRTCEQWERSKKRSTWVNPSLIDVFPNRVSEIK